MEKPIDHSLGSTASTVAGGVLSGALKGVGFLALAGVGVALAGAAVVALAINAPAIAVGALALGGAAALTAPVWLPFAGIGAAIGAYKGGAKVRGEQKAFNTVAHDIEQNAGASVQQAGQQAYMAGLQEGVQAGRQEVIEKLQQVQAQQAQLAANKNEQAAMAHPAEERDQSNKWADRFKKDGKSISPESIAQQRDAASHAPAQIG